MKLENDDVLNSVGLMQTMNHFVNYDRDEILDQVNYKDVPKELRGYLPLLDVGGYLDYTYEGNYRVTPKGKEYLGL